MRKIILAAALGAFGLQAGMQAARAQSSVTLYGIIDAGITYGNNTGGHSNYQAVSGINQGNRWGLKGVEDLGGGTRAVFDLEDGFNSFNGTLQQGGREFGRQAYVGLSNDRLGTLTLGRQYDAIVDYLQPVVAATGGIQVAHPGDMDNLYNSFRISNAIKYTSVAYNGLTFGGLYSLGGIAGDFSNQSAYSAGLSYRNGPLGAALAFLHVNRPALATNDGWYTTSNVINGVYGANASAYQTLGAGVSYQIATLKLALDYTNVAFLKGLAGQDVHFGNYGITAKYQLTQQTLLGGSYTYTHGHVDALNQVPLYHSASLILDHYLTKRTDVYAMTVYQRAGGSAKQAQVSPVVTASTTRSQLVVRVGMSHRF